MTKNIQTLLLLAIILSFFSNCQTESTSKEAEVTTMAPPEKIYANYYVRYISDEGQLKAQASFLTGADKQHRKPATFNGVMMNSSEMRLEESNKAKPNYVLERDNETINKVSFSFINNKGNREKDLVVIPQIKAFGFNDKISRLKNNRLNWEGLPLGEKESLVLLFTNEQNRTLSTIVNGPTTEPFIDVPKEKLSKLELGKHDLYIVRKNRTMEEVEGASGPTRTVRGLTEYYSQTIKVEVIK